jgi:Rieske Fe-S protein
MTSTRPETTTPQPAPDRPREGVDRRAVLVGAATVAAAGVSGALLVRSRYPAPGAATPAATDPTPAQPGQGERAQTDVLAAAADVPRGGGVVLEKPRVVLTRGDDDVVRGFSATCTHQGCLVASVAKGTIDCPCHGSRFDATTGDVVAGPARRPLPSVAVAVRGDQIVTA